MNRALSYMMIGALCSGAVILYLQNKKEIQNAMWRMKQEGMKQVDKIKATFRLMHFWRTRPLSKLSGLFFTR